VKLHDFLCKPGFIFPLFAADSLRRAFLPIDKVWGGLCIDGCFASQFVWVGALGRPSGVCVTTGCRPLRLRSGQALTGFDRLNPARREDQEVIVKQLELFFFGEGPAVPKEYVPPAQK
jgi:hypothetical protein